MNEIPIGTLVEIKSYEGEDQEGVRLYVTGHTKDCDGTVLHTLGLKGFRYNHIIWGFLAENLKVIKAASC